MPAIIGRGGITINELEKTLGVHIDVEAKERGSSRGGEWFEMSESGNNFVLEVDISKSGMDAEIYVNDQNLTSTRVGKNGQDNNSKKI